MGGAGTESGLPWQHLQCTVAIVYLPLRGLANGGILIGPSLMLPTAGRIDSYPSLKRGEGESRLVGCGERRRVRQVSRHAAIMHLNNNTALMSLSLTKMHLFMWEKFCRDFDCMSSLPFPKHTHTHTHTLTDETHTHTLTDETHTHTGHTIPNAYKLGGVLISLTHEASFLGHQLTEAGLGRDGAQEVSHCPAAEPAAWVLQSPLPPSFPISDPPPSFPPIPLFPSLLKQPFRLHPLRLFFPAFLSHSQRRRIRCTAALCSSSITGHSNKETWTPRQDRSPHDL